jgi:hypothetical protein
VNIYYRKKDNVDRTQDAAKLQERLKSYGFEANLEKHNWKDYGTVMFYYNGQAELANRLAECIKDIFPLKVSDGTVSNFPNTFVVYLQQ